MEADPAPKMSAGAITSVKYSAMGHRIFKLWWNMFRFVFWISIFDFCDGSPNTFLSGMPLPGWTENSEQDLLETNWTVGKEFAILSRRRIGFSCFELWMQRRPPLSFHSNEWFVIIACPSPIYCCPWAARSDRLISNVSIAIDVIRLDVSRRARNLVGKLNARVRPRRVVNSPPPPWIIVFCPTLPPHQTPLHSPPQPSSKTSFLGKTRETGSFSDLREDCDPNSTRCIF